MENLRISAIIPVYNAAAYLRECVESILSQPIQELEVILVDDGSQDGSPALCDQLAQEDNRVHVIHQPNGGVSVARNRGIEEARGAYVTFVDADDYLFPEALTKLWHLVEAHPGVDIVSAAIEKDGHTIGPTYASFTFIDDERLLRHSTTYELFSFFPVAKLFRRAFLNEWKLRFTEGIVVGEDTLFSYFAQKHVQSVAICHEAIYYYRQNENSVMHEKDFTRNLIALFQVARIVARNLDEEGRYGQTRFLLDRLAVAHLDRIIHRPGRYIDMKVIHEEISKTHDTIKHLPLPFCVKLAAWRLSLPLKFAKSMLVDWPCRILTKCDLFFIAHYKHIN